jgi:hypothetical protein
VIVNNIHHYYPQVIIMAVSMTTLLKMCSSKLITLTTARPFFLRGRGTLLAPHSVPIIPMPFLTEVGAENAHRHNFLVT